MDDETLSSDNCLGGGCALPAAGLVNGRDASAAIELTVPTRESEVAAVFQATGNQYRLSDDRAIALTGHLPFGLTSSLLGRAYIATNILLGIGDGNVAAQHPMTRNLIDDALAGTPKDIASSAAYWAIQSLDSFECRVNVDNDPTREPALMGLTPGALVGRVSNPGTS